MKHLFSLATVAAAFVLSIFAASCSKNDTTDTPYAAITSSSFTFDETTPSRNTVGVAANTSWQVCWTPASAAVTVSPASGSGDGSFAIRDMPKGTSVQIGVRAAGASGSDKTITVTRLADAVNYELELTPKTLVFKPSDASANVVAVTSNTSWVATPSSASLKINPASGTGNGRITVADIPAGESHTLTVKAGEGANARTQSVTVSREAEPVGETVFALSFGNAPNAVWADQNTQWQTQTGSGAPSVSYAMVSLRIQNDNFGSAGKYAGASGQAYGKMFYDAASHYFAIQNITLPAAQTNFTLSFGAIFPEGDVTLSVGGENTPWRELTYKGAATYNTWTKVTVGFTLKTAVTKLSIRFAPKGVERDYGLNFDDVTLTTGGGGQTVDITPSNYRWAELPSSFETPSSDQFTHTTWTTTVNTNKRVRNYSYCYDTRRHNPVWVAYPHHACYNEGGYGRTTPDPWAADPAFDASKQSKIYQTDAADPYQFWTWDWMNALLGGGYWSRGHLCMSRERGGAGKQINIQTFHPTNIAPQASAPSTFGEIWGSVEAVLSGSRNTSNNITADDGQTNINIVSDTLYIVAGCYYEHDNWIEKDASNSGELSGLSKNCIMPTHQFKMALRTKAGNTGKAIKECSADELQAVAFWIESLTQDQTPDARAQLRATAVPVSFVEQKMGMTFFPDVPASVKADYNAAEWGF